MTLEVQQNQAVAAASGDPDGLRARAITTTGDKQVLSYERQEDARTALARGLKEYLEQFSINWVGGRLLKWEGVVVEWGDSEEPANYPSLGIVGDGPGEYDAAELTPRLVEVPPGKGESSEGHLTKRYIKETAELVQTFTLVVWTTDKVARSGLVAMLEDVLEPADHMTGLLLELPYYFNARAIFEKLSIAYDDSAEDASRRWRRAMIQLTANIPQIVPRGDIVIARPRVQSTLDDTQIQAPLEGVTHVGADTGPTADC